MTLLNLKNLPYGLLSITLFMQSNSSWAETFHYGYGFNPEDALRAAIEVAKRESPARCLAKNWSPKIDKDCQYAGDESTYVDANKKEVGPYQCRAQGSKHKGSCK